MIPSNHDDFSNGDASLRRNRRALLKRTHSPSSVACYPSFKLAKQQHNKPGPEVGSSATRSVRFHQTLKIRYTRSRHDYTTQQKTDCWYNAQELKDIRTQCASDLQRIRDLRNVGGSGTKESSPKEPVCLRGLETCLDARAHQRSRNIKAQACARVLDAYHQGHCDVMIARWYAALAAGSQTLSHLVGLRDRREANEIYHQYVSASIRRKQQQVSSHTRRTEFEKWRDEVHHPRVLEP